MVGGFGEGGFVPKVLEGVMGRGLDQDGGVLSGEIGRNCLIMHLPEVTGMCPNCYDTLWLTPDSLTQTHPLSLSLSHAL